MAVLVVDIGLDHKDAEVVVVIRAVASPARNRPGSRRRYLVTGKQRDEDGYRTEFRIACAEQSFHIRHGAGPPPSNTAKVVDIRLGWEWHVPEPPTGIEPR